MTSGDKRYHHGSLRDALLTAGDEVLAERGFKGFTMRECARRAGVSHAAPKHHFGSTAGFLTQLAAVGFGRLCTLLRENLGKSDDPDEDYAATTRTYLHFAEAYPEHFRIMFRCDLIDGDDPVLHKNAASVFVELTNVILRQRGEAEIAPDGLGPLKTDEVIQDILIGWSHIHGLAHLKLERQLTMLTGGRENELIERASTRLARRMRQTD